MKKTETTLEQAQKALKDIRDKALDGLTSDQTDALLDIIGLTDEGLRGAGPGELPPK